MSIIYFLFNLFTKFNKHKKILDDLKEMSSQGLLCLDSIRLIELVERTDYTIKIS